MSQLERTIAAARGSQMLRLCLIFGLALVLLVPIAMIWGLVSERQDRSQSAIAEVSSKWGNAQTIAGPALVLPYTVQGVERNVVFLPKALRTTGRINVEERS